MMNSHQIQPPPGPKLQPHKLPSPNLSRNTPIWSGDDDYDDDNIQQPYEDEDGLPWRTTAWLENAIRESVGKVKKYNERMSLLTREKRDGNYPVKWDELRGDLYREKRFE